MFHRGQLGRMAQMPDDDADLYGLSYGRLGQDRDDDFYGSIPMDELQGTACLGCAGPQVGYFSDDPDHELIGTYCPSCGKVGMGQYPEDSGNGLGQDDDDIAGLSQYPGEAEGYVDGLGRRLGRLRNASMDGEIPGIEDWPDDVGRFADDDADLVGRYGQSDDEVDGYGQYESNADLDGYGQYEEEMDGYVDEVPPPFNPTCNLESRLSGYEPERAVNPTVALRRTVPATPIQNVPDIFKPYF